MRTPYESANTGAVRRCSATCTSQPPGCALPAGPAPSGMVVSRLSRRSLLAGLVELRESGLGGSQLSPQPLGALGGNRPACLNGLGDDLGDR